MSTLLAAAVHSGRFTTLDWGVVVIYVLMIAAVGLWLSRGQQSKRDYFLGGRNIPWWAVGFSIVATETSALTVIGVPGMAIGALAVKEGLISASKGSMLFMMVVLGHIIGRIIIAVYIVPYYFKGDVYTPYQLLSRAFGQKARFVASGLALITTALGAGVRVYASAIPIMFAMRGFYEGWGINHSIALIMFIAMVYTSLGGIKAVVWTEILQYFIFVGGGLFALYYIPTLLEGNMAAPSGATHWAAVKEVAADNMTILNTGFLSSAELQAKLGESYTLGQAFWAQLRNIFCGDYNLIMGLLAVPPGIVLAIGFNQLSIQRVLCCRNTSDGRKSMIMSACLIAPQFLMFLLIGICLFAFYKINGFQFFGFEPWDPNSIDAATGIGKPKADYVFPSFIMTQMPEILKGFMVAAILSAAMSSESGALSAMSSMVVMDFYKPLQKQAEDERKELMLSRITTLFCGLALAIVAYLSQSSTMVFDLAFTFAGLTSGGILGAFVIGMIRKRGFAGPIIAGMVCSFLFMVLLNLVMSTWSAKINWTWHIPIGMLVALLVIRLALIGLPDSKDGGIAVVEGETTAKT